MSSLKEGATTSSECIRTPEEHSTAVDEWHERPEPVRANEPKIRKCLICRSPFASAWAGERICRRCKSTAAWRSGALK